MDRIPTEAIERYLKKMGLKRKNLFEDEKTTAEDWDDLADEYESLEFTANASSCRVRAKQMREMAVGDAS